MYILYSAKSCRHSFFPAVARHATLAGDLVNVSCSVEVCVNFLYACASRYSLCGMPHDSTTGRIEAKAWLCLVFTRWEVGLRSSW